VAIREGRVVRNDDNLPGIPNSGTLLAARANYVNSAATTLRGIDFDVRQEFELGAMGKLAFDMQWSRINLFRREDGGSVFQYAGTHGNCDTTNCAGTPKDRANAGLTWSKDRWSASVVANYIGGFDNIAFENDPAGCANIFADGSDAPNGCRIPSFTTFDLSGKWKLLPKLELSASVQNVTDRIAPLDPLTYGSLGYNPMHYSGAVGRYFTIGVRYDFN
jgi:iron complex outermembrane receptor protein